MSGRSLAAAWKVSRKCPKVVPKVYETPDNIELIQTKFLTKKFFGP